jgi:hypothetical protein
LIKRINGWIEADIGARMENEHIQQEDGRCEVRGGARARKAEAGIEQAAAAADGIDM